MEVLDIRYEYKRTLAATGSPVTLAQLAMPRLVVMAVLAFK
jgi:hypothetical protein